MQVAHLHMRHIWPLHPDLAEVLGRYQQVLIPEINSGQLRLLIQSQLGIRCLGYNRVRGLPLRVNHLLVAFEDILEGRYDD